MLNKIRYIEKIMFDQMSHLFNNIFLSISQGPKGSIKKLNGEKKHVFKYCLQIQNNGFQ